MEKKLLDIFANFNIDSQERLKRMKDSFHSFKDFDQINKWVINIRGSLKNDAKKFLKKKLKNNIIFFHLNSKKGWFYDSRKMISSLEAEFVFFWIEDHIFLNRFSYFKKIILDLKENNLEMILYSWFHKKHNLKSIKSLKLKETKNMFYGNYNKIMHQNRLIDVTNKKLLASTFIVSCLSIFSKKLFFKIIKKNDPIIPRWPKETPFDFEKQEDDTHWLPIRMGFPKQELFAPIDDDHEQKNYSLISRGIYPDRAKRKKMLEIRNIQLNKKNKTIFNSKLYNYKKYNKKAITLINKIYSKFS